MTTRRPPTRSTAPLKLINQTYVSESRIPRDNHAQEIDLLLTRARRSNEMNGITGALLFSGNRFVQTLEGPAAVICALMTRIEGDCRHSCVVTVDRHEVAERGFARWSMAYSGSSVFVARTVDRALASAGRGESCDVKHLLRLVHEFAAASPVLSDP